MSRNIFIITLILVALFIPYCFQGNNYLFFIDLFFILMLEILRLKYMKLNWRQILLTLILGPLTFLLGRQSDYWWKMWQKDPVKTSK